MLTEPSPRRRFGSMRWVIAGVLAFTGSLFPADSTAAEPTLEYGVKATFLLNFTKFIEWPPTAFANPDSPLGICILGKDPFGRVLDDIVHGEAVNGHKLIVRRTGEPPPRQACQILFVDPGLSDQARIIESLGSGVLTVGEGDRFIREGGMIAFVVNNRRVRFEINQAAAEKGALKLSSKLLSVARAVVR